MSLTLEQIAKIRKKEANTPDALKRNPLNKYTEGWFHVTLNVRGDAPVLGYIVGDPDASDGSKDAPRCELTELGKAVENEWKKIYKFYPFCICEEIQIMPEHLHALLHLMPGNNGHLGRIINGLMIGCTHNYWDTLGIPWKKMRMQLEETLKRQLQTDKNANYNQQSKALRSQWQDRDHTCSYRGPSLFVRGYNDVEAVTPEQIEIKRLYIRNNPRKRLITRSKPDRFRVVKDNHSVNWTLERAFSAIADDPMIKKNPDRFNELKEKICQRLKRSANTDTLAIDYVGNRELLAAKRKISLICHRKDAARFEQQKSAVLDAARDGAVVVSAFISPKEREIMKQLMIEQIPFIEIMDNGFSDRYKPIGKAFYSTAENRHVQLSCWTYLYQAPSNENHNISREMCLVMNELVRLISGVEDDWWIK